MSASATVLLYLLKANAVLLLLAAAYFGLLRRLTFFTLNRAYLLLALLFAAVYPALPVPALLPAETAAVPVALVLTATATGTAVAVAPVAPPIDWAVVAVAVYATGAAVLLGRLLVQLLSLARLRRRTQPAIVQGHPVRVLPGEISPFSFGSGIYLNPDQHPGPELVAVLRHEQVHVRQGHTFDVLLAQLALAAAWCNPAAWLLRRAVLDNLEYLADQAVLAAGLDRRTYQYSLVRLSQASAGLSFVSHFTFPTLKNRLIMMNTPHSTTGQLARYFVAGPLVLVLALGVAGARAQGDVAVATPAPAAAASRPALTSLAAGPVYYLDGVRVDKARVDQLDAQTIAYMNMLDEATARQVFGAESGKVAVVVTKAQQNSAAVLALNARIAKVVPLVPGTETAADINVLTPKALSYITTTYPNARIIGVKKLSYPTTSRVLYRAELAEGRRPTSVLFDEQGNVAKLK